MNSSSYGWLVKPDCNYYGKVMRYPCSDPGKGARSEGDAEKFDRTGCNGTSGSVLQEHRERRARRRYMPLAEEQIQDPHAGQFPGGTGLTKTNLCKRKAASNIIPGAQRTSMDKFVSRAVGIINKMIELAERHLSVAPQLYPPLSVPKVVPPNMDTNMLFLHSDEAITPHQVNVALLGIKGAPVSSSQAPVPLEPVVVIAVPICRPVDDKQEGKGRDSSPLDHQNDSGPTLLSPLGRRCYQKETF
ncbi:hypothetical protein NDU88_000983 [Pleurodeles waltl]|uniref:Uncharacterized protein n=1 Tax=Pleurodeles waltl TaxID=8319 RepID=A0AAV7LBF8_PLEWA|nr:hypothetical protein NDU88_000983 [Pleurodeles waltl]